MAYQLDLRDLRYFETIAELGHLGQAAKRVHRTQPALTSCVRRLEAAFGTPLFERVGRGIRLTPAGALLLARAQRLRLAADETAREMEEVARGVTGPHPPGRRADRRAAPAACGLPQLPGRCPGGDAQDGHRPGRRPDRGAEGGRARSDRRVRRQGGRRFRRARHLPGRRGGRGGALARDPSQARRDEGPARVPMGARRPDGRDPPVARSGIRSSRPAAADGPDRDQSRAAAAAAHRERAGCSASSRGATWIPAAPARRSRRCR